MCVSSLYLLPHLVCLDLSELSNWEDMEDAMDMELLSLSKPRSGEGDGDLGNCSHCSLHLLLCPHPLEGHRGVCLSSEPLWADASLGRGVLEVLNLKGC